MNAAATKTVPSDEVDQTQIDLAKSAGEQYLSALDYMAKRVADTGSMMQAGDYVVAFAQEGAEGMYRVIGGALTWADAAPGTNCHIEIAVLDADDHRFIPSLSIECVLIRDGKEIVRFTPEFLWHPGLFHYGKDVEVPESGIYDLRVAIAVPTFGRHDKRNGRRYAEPVAVTFKSVHLETGRG